MFTSSQSWTVPAGVSSAFVTMAGGGGSGAGWRIVSATFTGHSGGYVFSQPVNLVAGETIQVIVGQGAQAFAPYQTGVPAQPPHYIYAAPAGDDGLSGYPGTSSKLVSPSAGTLLECDGGSGAFMGEIDNYSGSLVPGPQNGAQIGSGNPSFPAGANRVASGPYATAGGPGACGPALYGVGNQGTMSFAMVSGVRTGASTPFGYGSGGDVGLWGCYVDATTIGACISPSSGRSGVVFIDVLY